MQKLWPALGGAVVGGLLLARHLWRPIASQPKAAAAAGTGAAGADSKAKAVVSAERQAFARAHLVQPAGSASPGGVQIVFLADRPDAAAVLAPHMHAQWTGGYASFGMHTAQAVRDDLLAHNTQYDALPVTLVALVDGAVAGTASLDVRDIPQPHPYAPVTPWMVSVFVLPQYRGRGLAGALTASIVSVARTVLRVPHVWLFTYAHESAASIYAKHGFRLVERTRFPKVDAASAPAAADAKSTAVAGAAAATAAVGRTTEDGSSAGFVPTADVLQGKAIDIMRVDFYPASDAAPAPKPSAA